MDAHAVHERYGEVVRIAPNEVTFTNPEAWKEIFALRPGKPQRPKDQRHVSVGPNHIPSTLRTDDATHSRYRRSLSHGFSESSLQRQEVKVVNNVGYETVLNFCCAVNDGIVWVQTEKAVDMIGCRGPV